MVNWIKMLFILPIPLYFLFTLLASNVSDVYFVNLDVGELRTYVISDATTRNISWSIAKQCRNITNYHREVLNDTDYSIRSCQAGMIENYVAYDIEYTWNPDYDIASAGEIIKKGYGNCRNQAVVAATLLKESGFSKVYMVAQYGYYPFMGRDFWGHVCVLAETGSNYYFVNCIPTLDFTGIYKQTEVEVN